MNAIEKFHHNYPLTLLDGVFTVCIGRQGWLAMDPTLPPPAVKGIKPFIHFCGYSDSALRTALSRERKKDNLIFFTDDDNIERLDMASFGQGLTRFHQNGLPSIDGLTIAVFQFSTGQNKARYILKDILKGFCFKMLTQNIYISMKVPHSEIENAAEEVEVAEHLYLFDAAVPEGRALEKIKEVYSVDDIEKKYTEFLKDLSEYFQFTCDDESVYHRALYAGAAHHQYNRMVLPPLPGSVFPGIEVFSEIELEIISYFKRNFEIHKRVYLKNHGGES